MRVLEQMRIVGIVRERIDQREPAPRVALHVEDQPLDLMLCRLHSETGAASAVQLHLHLLKIDHGGAPNVNETLTGRP